MSAKTTSGAPQADPTLLRPADAARRLGIPASTLRRWSRRFAPFLSPEANAAVRENGARGHRRYTPQDMAVLARCKVLLSQGHTFEQAARELETTFQPEAQVVEGEVEMQPDAAEPGEEVIVVDEGERLEMTPGEDAVEVGRMMAQLLSSLSGSQQMLITGQQTERELLGVLLQDNFNLKEENKKLRERMVETERRIFEMKREMEKNRKDEQERMRQLEAYLFQLQRQMDDLVRRRTPPAAAPAVAPAFPAVAPQPVRREAAPPAPQQAQPQPQPAPEPKPQAAESSQAGAEEAAAPSPAPRKRSFWAWLLGR